MLPTGQRIRYQVLRIGVPLRGRALPLVQLAYNRDALPPDRSQNQLEEAALAAVLAALPVGWRPVVLADAGLARPTFLQFLQAHGVDFVVRIDRGTVLTAADGTRTKLGTEGLRPGQLRLAAAGALWPVPRSAAGPLAQRGPLLEGGPRAPPGSRRAAPDAPWYLATSLSSAGRTVGWYWRRGWIEQSFKDAKARFASIAPSSTRPSGSVGC